MYRKFKVDINDINSIFQNRIYDKQKYLCNEINSELEDFWKRLESGKAISAENIISEWFPRVQADVFLSHSHQDKDEVIQFANYLYQEFGLKAFIDSEVWLYMNNLLKGIDDRYCYSYEDNTYSYEKRNNSTAHVHTILMTALTRMIDTTECVIFINSENTTISVENGISETNSPWIYLELMVNNIINQQKLKRKIWTHSYIFAQESTQLRKSASDIIDIHYETTGLLTTFQHLSAKRVQLWEMYCKKFEDELSEDAMNLDVLYKDTLYDN